MNFSDFLGIQRSLYGSSPVASSCYWCGGSSFDQGNSNTATFFLVFQKESGYYSLSGQSLSSTSPPSPRTSFGWSGDSSLPESGPRSATRPCPTRLTSSGRLAPGRSSHRLRVSELFRTTDPCPDASPSPYLLFGNCQRSTDGLRDLGFVKSIP